MAEPAAGEFSLSSHSDDGLAAGVFTIRPSCASRLVPSWRMASDALSAMIDFCCLGGRATGTSPVLPRADHGAGRSPP
jgi:hypothetical protein